MKINITGRAHTKDDSSYMDYYIPEDAFKMMIQQYVGNEEDLEAVEVREITINNQIFYFKS